MKKTKALALLLAMLIASLLVFTSCTEMQVADSGTASLVIEDNGSYEVYEVDLSKLENRDEGAISLLEYVASLEGSTLYFTLNFGGGYGAYINTIGTLSPDPSCEYISIYTTESCDFAVATEYMPVVSTVEYEGTTLTYSGVGLSSMSVKDGTVILFRVEGF